MLPDKTRQANCGNEELTHKGRPFDSSRNAWRRDFFNRTTGQVETIWVPRKLRAAAETDEERHRRQMEAARAMYRGEAPMISAATQTTVTPPIEPPAAGDGPLNQRLYDRLTQVFGDARIENQGIAAAIEGDEVTAGERYAVCCPFCADRGQHLSFHHLYGADGENHHLVVCRRENCQSQHDNGKTIRNAVCSRLGGAGAIAKAEIREGQQVESWTGGEVALPGDCRDLTTLPDEHPAILYLRGRGFEPTELAEKWGVHYCHEVPGPYVMGISGAAKRIITPVYRDGVPIAWQGRWPLADPEAELGKTRYYNLSGSWKSRVLYNIDRAKAAEANRVVVVEGTTAVWRLDGPTVATLGKRLSTKQAELLATSWPAGTIVVFADDDAAWTTAKTQWQRLATQNPGMTIVAFRTADGRDGGELSREEAWELVDAATAAANGDTVAHPNLVMLDVFRGSGETAAEPAAAEPVEPAGTATAEVATPGTVEMIPLPPRAGEVETAAAETPGERPLITVTADEHLVTRASLGVLARADNLYIRSQMLVEPYLDGSLAGGGQRHPMPRISPVRPALLREYLSERCRYEKYSPKGEPIPVGPPKFVVEAIAARSEFPGFRQLRGVSATPFVRADGTVVTEPGYDEATQVVYMPAGPQPEIQSEPTRDAAIAAAKDLLDLVGDFPFVDEHHRSGWLAMLLTGIGRHAFDGPSPLFLIDANTRGTGKGLLVATTGTILTGGAIAASAVPESDAEFRKLITAIAISGDQFVLLDNAAETLGCPALDAALTSTTWKDRLLGSNSVYEGPLTPVWIATGNNVLLGADTARRVLHIRLTTDLEKPEERTGFAHPNLLAHIREQRMRYLGALLTIARAWHAAGKPTQANLRTWGSFEGWSEVVRQMIVWLGLADPIATRDELLESADTAAEQVAAMIEGIAEMGQRHPLSRADGYTTSELIAAVKDAPHSHPRLKAAVETLYGSVDRANAQKLGKWLGNHKERVINGRAIDVGKIAHKTKFWTVKIVGAVDASAVPPLPSPEAPLRIATFPPSPPPLVTFCPPPPRLVSRSAWRWPPPRRLPPQPVSIRPPHEQAHERPTATSPRRLPSIPLPKLSVSGN